MISHVNSVYKPVLVKFLLLAVVLALVIAVSVAQVEAKATTVTTNYKTDLNMLVFVPCAAAGAGEYVQLSGSIHILFVTTIDSKGGFHSTYHFQPQGVSGTGLTTGAKYQATGVTQGTFNGKVGVSESFVNNFRIIGQGGAGKFLVHENIHVTVNANGEVTAFVDNFKVTCKGGSYPSYP